MALSVQQFRFLFYSPFQKAGKDIRDVIAAARERRVGQETNQAKGDKGARKLPVFLTCASMAEGMQVTHRYLKSSLEGHCSYQPQIWRMLQRLVQAGSLLDFSLDHFPSELY